MRYSTRLLCFQQCARIQQLKTFTKSNTHIYHTEQTNRQQWKTMHFNLLVMNCKLWPKMNQWANLNSPLSIFTVSISKLTTNQLVNPPREQRMWKISDILYKPCVSCFYTLNEWVGLFPHWNSLRKCFLRFNIVTHTQKHCSTDENK